MNRMAGTVIRQMDERQREEDDKIRKYEMEKEMRDRMEDERRMRAVRDGQNQMRGFLARQMEEKKHREHMEKALNDEQAVMWKQDLENYEAEEKRLNDKIKRINKENADFLTSQAQNKGAKGKKMEKQEFLINKPLLKEIVGKKKETDSQQARSKA